MKQLSERMKHKMEMQDIITNVQLVSIRVAYLLYKLTDAIDFLQCSESFTIYY